MRKYDDDDEKNVGMGQVLRTGQWEQQVVESGDLFEIQYQGARD